jgi:hypothetical protein
MKRADASELFNKMPIEQRRNAFLKSGETPVVPEAPTPTTPTAPTTGGAVPSYSEAKAIASGQKQFAESEGKAAGEETGKRQAALEASRKDLPSQMNQANQMLYILDNTPEAVGLRYRNKGIGLGMEAAEAGLIPGMGKKNLEGVVSSQLPREVRIAREKFDSLATSLAADYRREVAKGTGQVSDYETKMFQKASGLSKEDPAEANKYFAILRVEALRSRAQMLKAWDGYKTTNPGTSFAQFERDPNSGYADIIKENEDRLKKHFPEGSSSGIEFGERANKVSKSRIDELESIYGKKK